MHQGSFVFSQLMRSFSKYEFDKCVSKYSGNKGVRRFTCWNQFLALAFGQLSYRESLSDIVLCLNSLQATLYHLGFKTRLSKSTFSDANNSRDWRIYADFSHYLMTRIHQKISFSDALKKEYDFSIFALDSSLIRLCLNVFFWAKYRQTKSAVKIHTLLDVQSSIPYYFRITDGLVGDMSILKQLAFIPGAFYVMDRGYNDFNQLYRIHTSRAFFVLRAKSPLRFKRMYSNPKKENILVDQIGKFTVYSSKMAYPEKIRCIKSFDPESKSKIVLLTNNFEIEATDIAEFYRKRWQVELFFKWIKQHLKIKTFWGFSENAVKTQIYSALSVYLIVALLKYNLDIQQNLFEILQILSVSLLVKEPINEVFREPQLQNIQVVDPNQLKMW
jgi:hypothetical protein